MAALVIETGVPTHPQIRIKNLDLEGEKVNFNWVGGPYAGDCCEDFTLSLAEHGHLTVAQMVEAITAMMLSKLPEPS